MQKEVLLIFILLNLVLSDPICFIQKNNLTTSTSYDVSVLLIQDFSGDCKYVLYRRAEILFFFLIPPSKSFLRKQTRYFLWNYLCFTALQFDVFQQWYRNTLFFSNSLSLHVCVYVLVLCALSFSLPPFRSLLSLSLLVRMCVCMRVCMCEYVVCACVLG